MSRIVYACTHAEKLVEEDDFQRGCVGPTTCVLSESVNVAAPSLSLLIGAIGRRYGLDIDDVWVPDDEVTFIGFNRLENGDGDEPTEDQQARWRDGRAKLYLADYHFAIEKRVVTIVSKAEFANIKHHN